MKKVVLLIMLGLMVSLSVFAQQALKGTIRSKADKQPLSGVSVAIGYMAIPFSVSYFVREERQRGGTFFTGL